MCGTTTAVTVTDMLAETGARNGFETVTVKMYGYCDGSSVEGGIYKDEVDVRFKASPLDDVHACVLNPDENVQSHAKVKTELSEDSASGS